MYQTPIPKDERVKTTEQASCTTSVLCKSFKERFFVCLSSFGAKASAKVMQKTLTCKRKQKKISRKVHFSTKKEITHYYNKQIKSQILCTGSYLYDEKNGTLSPASWNFQMTQYAKKQMFII